MNSRLPNFLDSVGSPARLPPRAHHEAGLEMQAAASPFLHSFGRGKSCRRAARAAGDPPVGGEGPWTKSAGSVAWSPCWARPSSRSGMISAGWMKSLLLGEPCSSQYPRLGPRDACDVVDGTSSLFPYAPKTRGPAGDCPSDDGASITAPVRKGSRWQASALKRGSRAADESLKVPPGRGLGPVRKPGLAW